MSTKFNENRPNSTFEHSAEPVFEPSFPFSKGDFHPFFSTGLTNICLPCGSRGHLFNSGRWYHFFELLVIYVSLGYGVIHYL